MDNELKMPSSSSSNASLTQPTSGTSMFTDVKGKMTDYIGSGRPAQEAIVLYTLIGSFLSGLVLTLLFVGGVFLGFFQIQPREVSSILDFLFYRGFQSISPADFFKGIQNIWGIFVPIITLSLGYIFGKSK